MIQIPSVADYMSKQLITFKPDTHILEVIDTLLEHNISGAPIMNEFDEVVGLIDDKDCLRYLFGECYHGRPVLEDTVAHYTTNILKKISINTDLAEVACMLLSTPYKRFLVMDDNDKLVGLITRSDVLRAIKSMQTRSIGKN
jgi:CBS domain-containing protein